MVQCCQTTEAAHLHHGTVMLYHRFQSDRYTAIEPDASIRSLSAVIRPLL